MEILAKTGSENLAMVYIARLNDGKLIEFVESVEPPISKMDKWVLIVSTLVGCPIKCSFCDCSMLPYGKLDTSQILGQITFLVDKYFQDRIVPVTKFKIQFARVGEPTLNSSVLEVLEELPQIMYAPGLMPSISTVAPRGCRNFMMELLRIKNRLYQGSFQLQFSLHSTNEDQRDVLIPIKKWNFEDIASYGENFFVKGDRKITLNFALSNVAEFDSDIIYKHFDPGIFLIKITPVNPTFKSIESNIKSFDSNDSHLNKEIEILKSKGYDVILSIGEPEENKIGSNCGQHIISYVKNNKFENNLSYTYKLNPEKFDEEPIFQ